MKRVRVERFDEVSAEFVIAKAELTGSGDLQLLDEHGYEIAIFSQYSWAAMFDVVREQSQKDVSELVDGIEAD